MSQVASIQCLFCKRLNPAGAIFCNECGTQLNMQPCDRCGAIDARTSMNCYKCGAEFPLHEMPENRLAHEPMAGSQDVVPNTADVAGPPDPTNRQAPGGVIAKTQLTRLIAGVALSLALIAAATFVYFDRGQPGHLTQKPEVEQRISAVSGRTGPAETPQAAQPAAMSTPAGPTAKPAGGVDASGKASPTPSPSAGPPAAPRPPSANDANAAAARKESLTSTDCPQAVATLGLCNPDTRPGRR